MLAKFMSKLVVKCLLFSKVPKKEKSVIWMEMRKLNKSFKALRNG